MKIWQAKTLIILIMVALFWASIKYQNIFYGISAFIVLFALWLLEKLTDKSPKTRKEKKEYKGKEVHHHHYYNEEPEYRNVLGERVDSEGRRIGKTKYKDPKPVYSLGIKEGKKRGKKK